MLPIEGLSGTVTNFLLLCLCHELVQNLETQGNSGAYFILHSAVWAALVGIACPSSRRCPLACLEGWGLESSESSSHTPSVATGWRPSPLLGCCLEPAGDLAAQLELPYNTAAGFQGQVSRE